MYFYKLVVILLSCLTLFLGLAEGRRMRRRRGECQDGTYQHDGKTCCLCPSGYRLVSQCPDSSGRQCELCQSGFFSTHPNNDPSCRICTDCHSEATKMEVKDQCSKYSDTVCGCQENYYCDKGHLCRICQPCDACEEQGGVKIPCTFTNNTVCNGAKESYGAVVAIVVVVLILFIGGLIAFVLCKKLKQKIPVDDVDDDPKFQELLPKDLDVDLNPYLQEIASILPPKLMKDVARRTGMSNPDIEQHELNHPKDVKEQTYRLLVDWSQAQGLKEAYPTLITKLLELNAKSIADQIRQTVQREQATA